MKPGLYLSFRFNGKIQRKLVTADTAVDLSETTPAEEIIKYSELNFGPYAMVVDLIAYRASRILIRDEEGFPAVDVTEYQELLAEKDDLLQALEKENNLQGSLTRFALADAVPEDDGSALYIYESAGKIKSALAEVMRFQFRVNEILYDLWQGNQLDWEKKYQDLRESEFIQILTIGKDISSAWRLRSPAQYYRFLLLHFITEKQSIARCECCGRFFIPKTKKKTLYCDRVLKDEKNCKYWGPILKHRLEKMGSKVLDEFDRAKRRLYKRYERAANKEEKTTEKDLTLAEYYDWLDKATEARDRFLQGEINEEEALEIINGDPTDSNRQC